MSLQHDTKVFLVNICYSYVILEDVILEVQNEYERKVHSLVTDNAKNMNKLRTLVTNDSPDIIAYG